MIMNIAEAIKKARVDSNLSYRKLSDITGISHSHIRDIENGKYTPSFESAVTLAKALEINIRDIILSSYQAQLRQLLFELIETCDNNSIELSYNDWIQSNLPIQPLGVDKTKLQDTAFKIAQSLYSEPQENLLDKKLNTMDYIAKNSLHPALYEGLINTIDSLIVTTHVQNALKVKEKLEHFNLEIENENRALLESLDKRGVKNE